MNFSRIIIPKIIGTLLRASSQKMIERALARGLFYAQIKTAIFQMKIMQSTTESLMGKVTTTLAIQNLIDQADAERGM
ncbi:MAG: hypothetical protein ACMG55_20045, partial [Microcoleus sp.]